MSNKKNISVTYTDAQLRNLVEEYITQQKHDFTFKSLCSYILYRAMEEERTSKKGLYDTNQLSQNDCERVNGILKKIIDEKRLNVESDDAFTDETLFVKVKE